MGVARRVVLLILPSLLCISLLGQTQARRRAPRSHTAHAHTHEEREHHHLHEHGHEHERPEVAAKKKNRHVLQLSSHPPMASSMLEHHDQKVFWDEGQSERDFKLLYDLEQETASQPPETNYVNGAIQYHCDETFHLTQKACRDANAALARRALRLRRAETQRRRKEPPRPAPPPKAPELAIVDDLPAHPINIYLGDPIRLIFRVQSKDNSSDGGRTTFPISYFWSKDVIHPAETNEATGATFYKKHALLDDAGLYTCVASNNDNTVHSKTVKVNVVSHEKKKEQKKPEKITDWHPIEKQYNLHMCHDELVSFPSTTTEFAVPPVCDMAVTLCYGAQHELCTPVDEKAVEKSDKSTMGDEDASRSLKNCSDFDRDQLALGFKPDAKNKTGFTIKEKQRRQKACNMCYTRGNLEDKARTEADVWCEYDVDEDQCLDSKPARQKPYPMDTCKASLHKCHYLIRSCFFKYSSASTKHNFARCFFSKLVKPIQVPKLAVAGLREIKVDGRCLTGVDDTKLHYKYEKPFDPDEPSTIVQATPASHGKITKMTFVEDCGGSDIWNKAPKLQKENELEIKDNLMFPPGTCKLEVSIQVTSQDGKHPKDYTVAITTQPPDDSCTISDFAVKNLPFTFTPVSTYYAPLYTGANTDKLQFSVNQKKKVGEVDLYNYCQPKTKGMKGQTVPLQPGPNRIGMRYTTQAMRKCQLYTFIVDRRIPGAFVSHKQSDARMKELAVYTTTRKSGKVLHKLTPAFDPEWPTYKLTSPLSSSVREVTMNAIADVAGGGQGAHLTINGCGTQWSSESSPILLLHGPNVIDIEVMAPNARSVRHYRVTIERTPPPADGGSDEGNVLEKLELHMPFGNVEKLGLIDKTAMLSRVMNSNVDMVFLDAKTVDPRAIVTINGDAVYNGHKDESWDIADMDDDGHEDDEGKNKGNEPMDAFYMKPYKAIPIQYGSNRISIKVMRAGATPQPYLLQLIRQWPERNGQDLSSETTLATLEVGPMHVNDNDRWYKCEIPERQEVRAQDGGHYFIDAYVHAEQTTFIVRATTTHPNALMEVENSVINGDVSHEIPTPWSEQVYDKVDNVYYLTVTAEDGITTATYEIKINKACPRGEFHNKASDQCDNCRESGKAILGTSNQVQFLSRCRSAVCTNRCDVTCAECNPDSALCPNGHQCIPKGSAAGQNVPLCSPPINDLRQMCEATQK